MFLLIGSMAVTNLVLLALRVSSLKNRIISETLIRAETITTQVAPSVEFGEPTAAVTILGHLMEDQSIRAIQIMDEAGDVFAGFGIINSPSPSLIDEKTRLTDDSLWVSVPIIVDSAQIGSLALRSDLTELDSEIRRSVLMSIPINLVVVVLTLILVRRIVGTIIRPVTELADTATKIASDGDYSIRATKFADDEVGVLTDRFNHMLETISLQKTELDEHHARLARSERLESLGLLAGGVAHDLNNVLGPMVALPELILQRIPAPEPVKAELQMVSKSAYRASVIIQDLLSLARRGTYKLEPVDINELILDCLTSPAVALRLAEAPGVTCRHELLPELDPAKGSEPHLTQALLNLFLNGIESMGNDGRLAQLVVTTTNVLLDQPLHAYETIPPGSYILISVKDAGPGLPPGMQKRIFEPFFTSKKMGVSGSGLGLSVVYGVVHDHGGFLDVISTPGEGAEFRIYLQRELQATPRNSGRPAKVAQQPSARILIVDDYTPQRLLTAKLLESLGHETLSAPSGQEAISILRYDCRFDLMIVDMVMEDGFDGLDTIREALHINPDLNCIIATGFSETDRVKSALELGASTCLNKPYTISTLAKAISGALENSIALPS
ncbi:MAG: response regulator [Verrucomicrobiales bacterium]|nr:response regulator [Verrucomicrobiales bacterium]